MHTSARLKKNIHRIDYENQTRSRRSYVEYQENQIINQLVPVIQFGKMTNVVAHCQRVQSNFTRQPTGAKIDQCKKSVFQQTITLSESAFQNRAVLVLSVHLLNCEGCTS